MYHFHDRPKPVLISQTLWILASAREDVRSRIQNSEKSKLYLLFTTHNLWLAAFSFQKTNKFWVFVLNAKLILIFYLNLLQENLIKKKFLCTTMKFFMLELHPWFGSELTNSGLLLAKVIRLQIWTLGMLDAKANISQHMLEEQALHLADWGPVAQREISCCLRKRSLAARAESPPVSDQHRRNVERGISTGAQKPVGPSRRQAQFLVEGSQEGSFQEAIHSSSTLSDTPRAAASCTGRVHIRKQMCL